MSTIEGGMVCTNNEESYEILRMLRSHGMVREIANPNKKKYLEKNIGTSMKNLYLQGQLLI